MLKIKEDQLDTDDLIELLFYVEFKIMADSGETPKEQHPLYQKLDLIIAQKQTNEYLEIEGDFWKKVHKSYSQYYKVKMMELGAWFEDHDIRERGWNDEDYI